MLKRHLALNDAVSNKCSTTVIFLWKAPYSNCFRIYPAVVFQTYYLCDGLFATNRARVHFTVSRQQHQADRYRCTIYSVESTQNYVAQIWSKTQHQIAFAIRVAKTYISYLKCWSTRHVSRVRDFIGGVRTAHLYKSARVGDCNVINSNKGYPLTASQARLASSIAEV